MDKASLDFFIHRHPFQEVPPTKAGQIVDSFVSCPVRMAFSWLHEPRVNSFDKTKSRYEACFIIPPHVSLEVPQRVYANVAAARFGADFTDPARRGSVLPAFKTCVRPQTEVNKKDPVNKRYPAFGDTGVYLKADASVKNAPIVFNHQKQPMSCAPGKGVYSGAWFIGWFRFYAYPQPGKPMANYGVGCQIISLQKLADDEELRSEDKGRAFDVIAHQPPGATSQSGTGPAQPPTSLPGW